MDMLLKRFLVFATLIAVFNQHLSAQKMDDYKRHWETVAMLDKKNLPASALKEVILVFNLAAAAGNEAQQIKAAMYQMKYRNLVAEDNQEKNILFVDTLITKAKGSAKNILQSMLAELFWNYRQNNRHKFYNRTQLAAENGSDVSTWSIEKLNNEITTLYKASLHNEDVFKKTSLTGFEAIIEKGMNTAGLRPTLYDFLGHRALAYFMNEENDVTQPAYKFILNDENIFSPAPVFCQFSFVSKDSGSLYFNALRLFQNILRFHLADTNPAALIDADLLRLSFANEHGIFQNKDALYEAALKRLEATYANNPATAQAMYLRARLHYEKGAAYDQVKKKETKFELKNAVDICNAAISKFPGSEGASNCQNLLADIKMPSLELVTEKVNIPSQPFRSLVKYKNSSNIYLRVVATSREELKRLEKNDEAAEWRALVNLKVLKSWQQSLPDEHDFQQHSTEIKIDALASGTYMILSSVSPDFKVSDNFLARQIIYISNISYITNNSDELYVLDRDNGQPLNGADVQLWQQTYNYGSRKYDLQAREKYTADNNGYVKIKSVKDNYQNYLFQVKFKNDELFTDDNYYSYQYNGIENKSLKKTFLFTDRSIYRPGQTIFFKGIIVTTDGLTKKSAVVPDFKTRVILFDANNQKAGSLDLVSNKYGSFNGIFKLPAGLLNGQFHIMDSATQSVQYFNVEEYKRPKFLVEIKKPAGIYRVNDSVTVTGNAKAYAGNNIDGAKITYRVVRKVQYPVWFNGGGYRKIFPPFGNREEMEITNGATISNSNGDFMITFRAIPDETIDKKDQPVFYYEVSADVTDMNGETRSSNTSVAVSYQALHLNIISADVLPVDSLKKIKISSNNTNGLFEKTNLQLTIQRLQSPGRIFRERYWEAPDQFVMTIDEYRKNFPYDAYADEDQLSKWPLLDKITDITDSTKENSTFQIPDIKPAAGWYKIVVTTKDKYGEDVKAEKFIQLVNTPSETDAPIAIDIKNTEALPGEKISYDISTGFKNIWLIHLLSPVNKPVAITYKTIVKGKPFSNEIQINDDDRGGMSLNYAFVQHSRVYTGNQYFSIPWKSKDLSIRYETFRDKMLPGAEEKFKIKILGSQSEKVAAEALISMYDASLDQFKQHNWSSLKSIWPVLSNNVNWTTTLFGFVNSTKFNSVENRYKIIPAKVYDALFDNGWTAGYNISRYTKLPRRVFYDAYGNGTADQLQRANNNAAAEPAGEIAMGMARDKKNLGFERPEEADMTSPKNVLNGQNNTVQIRKNFDETAFFFPSMETDQNGNIEFSFTIPEALTSWKMMTLAHTKELASGYSEKTIITQKPLMVQPNAPRFVREADRMEFSAKVVNLSDSEITGTAHLELFDASNNKPIDGWFKNVFPTQYFTVEKGQSAALKFPIDIPLTFNCALTWRIKVTSKDGSFSDGEENVIPVLTNRMLVTETMPLNMRHIESKHFKFEKLLASSNSGSLTNQALTVESSSNPAWYAVQALPYLIEYPYECAEQNFNRYYANVLASYVSKSIPKIRSVFDQWKTLDSGALMSRLQQNETLKSALLEETPWILDAQNEAAQKRNIGMLFDMMRLGREKTNSISKLKEVQLPGGGFPWFKGGPDDRFITQYILTGIGHLRKLKALSDEDYNVLKPIVSKALPYLDDRLNEEYNNLKKYKSNLKNNNLSNAAIQYLYLRSFFKENPVAKNVSTAYDYYRGQARQFWAGNNKYLQAMIALSLYRAGDEKTARAIIASLKEHAISSDEMGMYFKEFSTGGYYWHQAPVESQALIIEAFSEIDKNVQVIDDLKTWLLKQKQTQNWKTTKATADACYALLLNGSDWLAEEKEVSVTLGDLVIKSTTETTTAGTGYFKKSISGDKVTAEMGNITVKVNSPVNTQKSSAPSWGAVYWQYFEDLDKITAAESPLRLNKKIFIEKNSENGPVLQAVKDNDELHIGDKIKVRIELKADRDMEYIHMKDMRAACMEPVNVISEYKWQGGLGYYETTKDAGTNFFFNWLPRGTYVFEYAMFVTHSGNFSNGVTTIQCMYAPEFSSHSSGIRVNVQ